MHGFLQSVLNPARSTGGASGLSSSSGALSGSEARWEGGPARLRACECGWPIARRCRRCRGCAPVAGEDYVEACVRAFCCCCCCGAHPWRACRMPTHTIWPPAGRMGASLGAITCYGGSGPTWRTSITARHGTVVPPALHMRMRVHQ